MAPLLRSKGRLARFAEELGDTLEALRLKGVVA
jgi:hypothetical protein